MKSAGAADFVSLLGLGGLFGGVEIFVLKKAFCGSGVDGRAVAGGTGWSIELFVVPGEAWGDEKRQGEDEEKGIKPRQEYGAQTRDADRTLLSLGKPC